MGMLRVSIREFRADLAKHISSSTPVAVTRHGKTVGYFIPTRGEIEADLAALRKASEVLDELLEVRGLDEDEVVSAFKAARQGDVAVQAKRKKPKHKAA
jgi:PHD/YefM family antitoxin component YafN of YafNO toxin-antitoxin module